MAFIEHRPTRSSNGRDGGAALDQVRVSFKRRSMGEGKDSVTVATFYIGKNISNQLGLSSSDKIKFYYDDKDMRSWMIKKSDNAQGYGLVDVSKKTKDANYLRFQMTWKVPGFQLIEQDEGVRVVKHEIKDGQAILIDAN